jgi:hypothetical protein
MSPPGRGGGSVRRRGGAARRGADAAAAGPRRARVARHQRAQQQQPLQPHGRTGSAAAAGTTVRVRASGAPLGVWHEDGTAAGPRDAGDSSGGAGGGAGPRLAAWAGAKGAAEGEDEGDTWDESETGSEGDGEDEEGEGDEAEAEAEVGAEVGAEAEAEGEGEGDAGDESDGEGHLGKETDDDTRGDADAAAIIGASASPPKSEDGLRVGAHTPMVVAVAPPPIPLPYSLRPATSAGASGARVTVAHVRSLAADRSLPAAAEPEPPLSRPPLSARELPSESALVTVSDDDPALAWSLARHGDGRGLRHGAAPPAGASRPVGADVDAAHWEGDALYRHPSWPSSPLVPPSASEPSDSDADEAGPRSLAPSGAGAGGGTIAVHRPGLAQWLRTSE